MSAATLIQFKGFLRELSDDLNDPLQFALDAATAEASAFLGFDAEEQFGSDGPPSDVVMAVMVLAQVHADAGSPEENEHRRGAAQKLLLPYRTDTGMGAA